MGGSHPERPFDSILAGARTSEEMKRVACRRLFREMVKGETENGPLSMFRRWSLIRFARRLSIDPIEAKLIIRGVEYESGLIPAASVHELMEAERAASRRRLSNIETFLRIGLIGLIAVLFTLLFRFAFGAIV